MKKFVNKLIGRFLGECVIYAENYEKALNIANQLAKEYNNGWIACSERLPEIDGCTSDTVLVCTVDGFRHMAFWCDDGKWRYCESGQIKKPMEWTEIIAWHPLPAPYKEGDADELS